jgi:hypothetical protein
MGNPPERDGMNLKKHTLQRPASTRYLKRPSFVIYRLSNHHVFEFLDVKCLCHGKEVLSIRTSYKKR